ncbi:MAG TPA: hypothetical protein DDY82_00580, partial [Clostridiales bacterium]|nr:hypothetical protein [Clostridiales bacterium]
KSSEKNQNVFKHSFTYLNICRKFFVILLQKAKKSLSKRKRLKFYFKLNLQNILCKFLILVV